jgi:cell wall-associated NlpC family hydrolase
MKRIFAVAISLAMLVATPGLATADSTHQQAINVVIARALSQRGVPYAYGGGNVSGPSLGTVSVDTPAPAVAPAPVLGTDPLAPNVGATGLNLSPVGTPVAEPRVTRVGFDSSGLIVYAFAGAGIKMPRSSASSTRSARRCCRRKRCPAT